MCVDNKATVQELKEKVKAFCEERDWDKFHGFKDLSISLIIESAELLENFRFKSEQETLEMLRSQKTSKGIEDELADVLFNLLRMSQLYHIDISEAFERKMLENEKKYSIANSKGQNKKYTEYLNI